MAKSQSESPLPNAFPLLSLRGALARKQSQRIRRGEKNDAWPGQNAVLNVVRGFSLVQEHKESTTLKGRTTEKGQPEMRQA